MKPKNILLGGFGTVLIFFAISCGAGEMKDESYSDVKEENGANEKTVSIADELTEEEPSAEASTAYKDSEGDADKTDFLQNKKNEQGLEDIFSSSAAMVDPKDTIHKFIRTGDIRFRVNKVAEATYRIEDITRKFKGFVTYTSLHSHIDRMKTREISEDSVLRSTFFTVENTITVRIPSENLDTALKEISKLVRYIDYRNLSANDVRLQILSNKLEKRRLDEYNRRMSRISNSGNTNQLDEKSYIEGNILEKQAQKDQAYIEDLSLEDQIEYATITFSIYQHEDVIHEMLPNEANIDNYRPSVGGRILDSLKAGWYFIEDLIVGLIAAWPLFLIIGVVFVILRKNGYLKRKQ